MPDTTIEDFDNTIDFDKVDEDEFSEDYKNSQEYFNDLYTDGTGNCYSDADPGL